MYLGVVVPLEPSPLPNWAENSWERQDSSLPTGDISCCLGPPLECYLPVDPTAPGWARLTGDWDRGFAHTVTDERASSPEQEHAGTWCCFYDKRNKGSIFPTFSHRGSLLSHPLPATPKSQEEFLCYATKYLAKQSRSVQQIKTNAKRVCLPKDLGRSNVFEHLGAGFF